METLLIVLLVFFCWVVELGDTPAGAGGARAPSTWPRSCTTFELSSLRSQTLGAKGPRGKGNRTPSGTLYPFAPLFLGPRNKLKNRDESPFFHN